MKKVVIGAVLLLVLAGGAFVAYKKGKSVMAPTNPTSQTNTVISSIKDALSKSVSLNCDFTDETGNHVQTSVKNGAVRATITSPKPDESGDTIIKDKKIYFWNSKSAIMMTLPDVTPGATSPQAAQADQATSAQDSIVNDMEKYKASCHPAIVSDSVFTPPADVKFTDFSQLMQAVPSAPASAGKGAPQVDYQKMMQQYQQK